MENKRLQKIIQNLIQKAVNVEIISEVPLEFCQTEDLLSLNEYCVHQVLSDPEVVLDPRKINYKTNQELKAALVAFCLAQSLTNPLRKTRENKEWFEENISIYMQDEHTKVIGFGEIAPENVQQALFTDIIEDWKIYRDKEGFGIKTLIDEKTNLAGLDNYQRGGDPVYEFARFHRKYTEKERRREEKAREAAQDAFRAALVQSLAQEAAKQQLLKGENPLQLLEQIFNSAGPKTARRQPQEIDPQIEKNITKMLEYSNSRNDNSRSR